MSFFRDTLQKIVASTDVATTTIDCGFNLGGLTPVVIWVLGMNRGATTSAGVAAGDLVFSRGFAVSPTSRRALAVGSDHAAATSDTGAILRNDCLLAGFTPVGGTPAGRLDLNSVGADAAQLIVDQQFTETMTFYITAVAGTDITGAAILDWVKQAGTGVQSITGFGLNPKYLDTMSVGHTANNAVVGCRAMIGLATTSPVANGVLSVVMQDGVATSNTSSYCNDVEHVVLNQVTTSPTARGRLTAGVTDGVEVTWDENVAGSQIFTSLALAGSFQCKVGSFLTQTDTTTEVESAQGFPYELALLLSHAQAESTSDTTQDHAMVSAGFAHGPLEASVLPFQGAMSFVDVDNLADTAVSGVLLDIDATSEADYINISTAGAIDGLAQMFASATPPANSIVHKMTNADPAQALVLYATFASAAAVTGRSGGRMRKILLDEEAVA